MEKNGGSRLLQMQARFQQKQLQERELKIASLYEAQQARALDRVRHSPSSNGVSSDSTTTSSQTPVQPGKVRQMFEERRTKGIDKSYPLQPIHNKNQPAQRKVNEYKKVATSTQNARLNVEKTITRTHTITNSSSYTKQQHKRDNIVNGSGDLNHNHEPDLNSVKQTIQNSREFISSIDELDKADKTFDLLENETFPEALAPTSPRTPEFQPEPKKPPRRSPAPKAHLMKTPVKPQPAVVAPPRKIANGNAVSENNKPRGAMQRTPSTVPRRQPAVASAQSSSAKARSSPARSSPSEGGPSCAVCGRRFAPDRLAKHQEICSKAHAKKRKPFDVLKHRLAGTEAEPFINKLRKSTAAPSATKVNNNNSKPLNSNWRQKHEEFIQAIRAAKQVQAHLNAGGKLSDLPPPPPSENPDYVQCPHCSRRFNQGAAERHIPKCKNYQFNKPKPNAGKRR